MDAFAFLDRAEKSANQFKKALQSSSGFPLTKWFQGLSKAAKLSMVAMSIGATGCSSLAHNPATSAHNTFSQMQAEAQQLDAMPRSRLGEVIQTRKHVQAFDHLERTTIEALAAKIGSSPGNSVPLEDPVAIESPFTEGHLIQISRNDDWSANWERATQQGFGIAHAFSTLGIDNPHALNANFTEGAVHSFDDTSKPTYIVLPGQMSRKTWGFGTPSAETESIAFTLFHEAAHNHMTQEMVLHLGESEANDVGEAHHKTYKILNEVHSNITATLAVNKSYNLSPSVLIERLDTQIAMENGHVLAAGMRGAPDQNNGMGQYRGTKAYEVLKELATQDPTFLQNLTYQEMPLVAYDIARAAGYHHNAAELLLEERLSDIDNGMEPWVSRSDSALLSALESSLPERAEIDRAIQQIKQAWKDHTSRNVYGKYAGDLNHSVENHDRFIPRRSVEMAHAWAKMTRQGGSDVAGIINAQAEATESETNPAKLFAVYRDTHEKMSSVLRGMPTSDQIKENRLNALADLKQTLKAMDQEARNADKSSLVASGTGQSTQEITDEIVSRYGDSARLANDHEIPENKVSLAP